MYQLYAEVATSYHRVSQVHLAMIDHCIALRPAAQKLLHLVESFALDSDTLKVGF